MIGKKVGKLIKTRLNNRGLTLIELIVTIAVMSVVSAMAFSTFSNSMEDQRKKTDMSMLNSIDTSLMQILMDDHVFEEIKNAKGRSEAESIIYEKNKMHLVFYAKYDSNTKKGSVSLADTEVNGWGRKLENTCPTLYAYLVEYVGNKIDFTSRSYRNGTYVVNIAFNGAMVSELRGFTIVNDNIAITNSGDEYLS